MDIPDAAAAQELGSIAHGPLLLAAVDGVTVGLRCVFAHPTGLHLPIVLLARGVHADAANRRMHGHGDEFRLELGSADGTTTGPLAAFATQSAGGDDEYRQESAYWHAGLPHDPDLTVTVSWAAIGLPPVTTPLRLPDLPGLAQGAVRLP
jgi:hypothetical protein